MERASVDPFSSISHARLNRLACILYCQAPTASVHQFCTFLTFYPNNRLGDGRPNYVFRQLNNGERTKLNGSSVRVLF